MKVLALQSEIAPKKNKEQELEFQLKKDDAQNIQSKIQTVFLTESMINDCDNLLRNQMDALSYEVYKSSLLSPS